MTSRYELIEWIECMNKLSKKKRPEEFSSVGVWLIEEYTGFIFEGLDQGSWTKWVCSHSKLGILEYFPKSNTLHVHKDGSDGWHDYGLYKVLEIYDKYGKDIKR